MQADARPLSVLLAEEAALVREAAEVLPHSFSTCTYALGSIRQAVYLCLTCGEQRGICSACSVACHTNHEQLELFPKRTFRCDCPTRALSHPCSLYASCSAEKEPLNEENVYGQNFQGTFCRCGRPYDAKQERETMIQCLACEDWFHESCLNLRERPLSREPTPEHRRLTAKDADVDDASDVSDLLAALITDDDYDSLICRTCVLLNPTLRRWAGTKGAKMVVRTSFDESWTVLNGDSWDKNADVPDIDESREALLTEVLGQKRGHSESSDGNVLQRMKRLRTEKDTRDPKADIEHGGAVDVAVGADSEQTTVKGNASMDKTRLCLAPQQPAVARKIMDRLCSDSTSTDLGAGDVFFTEGFRTRWCRCDECFPLVRMYPYLQEEEETYEPPEDPDSASSLEDLGIRALQNLPHDRAINGILAYNHMRDELMEYLRPFAEQGKVVSEEDVRQFFDDRQEALRLRALRLAEDS